jgi:type IV pilus assembly protein PilW
MFTRVGKKDGGFTLVELLVGLALGLVVAAGVLNIFVHQNRTNEYQQEVAYAQQNVRAAMELMTREIRSAGYNPENNSFDAVKTATASSIRVLSNVSGDSEAGDPDDADEDVTYTIDNGNGYITRSGNEVIRDVVPNSLQFTYYKADGTALVPASQEDRDTIRTVGVQFQVHTEKEDPNYSGGYDLNPSGSGTCRVRTLSTRVRIRNVGFQDLE